MVNLINFGAFKTKKKRNEKDPNVSFDVVYAVTVGDKIRSYFIQSIVDKCN